MQLAEDGLYQQEQFMNPTEVVMLTTAMIWEWDIVVHVFFSIFADC